MAIIYISSTYSDLKKEREAAAKAIRRLGHRPITMEDYVATDTQPVDKCLQDVRSCDAYVGIIAWRYGYIPDGYDKGITHLEFEAARKSGIPCLIFMLDKNARWPVKYVPTGEERKKIDQLRNELKKEHIVSFFRNADELSGLISTALGRLFLDQRRLLLKSKLNPIVSKMCARVGHVNGFAKFFLTSVKKYPKRPHFYFLHGDELEGHDILLERLMKTVLKEYSEKIWGEEYSTIRVDEVGFPKEGNLEDRKTYLQMNLMENFGRLHEVNDFTVNFLARLHSLDKRPLVLIKHNIYSSKWDKHTQPLLSWYIKEYWAALECDDKDEIPLFLIFFLVRYQSVKDLKTKIFRRRYNSKEHIREQLYSICASMDEESQCLLIPELMPVEIEDVKDWFSEYNIYENLSKRKQMIDTIFRDENNRVAKSKSMAIVELELQKILEAYDANVNLYIDDIEGVSTSNKESKKEDLQVIICSACNGTKIVMCTSCLGSGRVENLTCPNCNGIGKIVCSYCGGTGWVSAKESIEIIKKPNYNDEVIELIKKEKYEEALLIIVKAENQRFADDNTRALKEQVIKDLSDDEEQSFKKQTKEGRSINYPEAGSTLGRDEKIKSVIEILDKTPIITVYGIPGIGKSVFIHDIRKSEPHNNRLYKRVIVKPGMTVNDLFQQLALLLGCRDMLNRPDFDLSKQSDFSFLETKAQYRVTSLIHLDDAQHLFLENQFRDNAVKEFLVTVTRYYPDTRIILECRIVPPVGIFPGNLHQSIRLHGIDKGSLIIYFKQPFKNNLAFGWELDESEKDLILKNICGIKEKGKVHPLAMVLLARMAKQFNKTPPEILTNSEMLEKLIDESVSLILNALNKNALQATGQNIPQNIEMYLEDTPAYLFVKLNALFAVVLKGTKFVDLVRIGKYGESTADYLEEELRSTVSKKSYGEGKKLLQEIIKLDKERKERLNEEFGYIYNFDNLEADENQWAQKEGQIEWRRKVWQVISMRNNFELKNIDPGEKEEDKVDIPEAKTDKDDRTQEQKISDDKAKKTSEEIGEELEKAVLKLFKDFFNIWEEDNTLTLTSARQQVRGLQFGHDLKFVCGRLGDKEIRFLIECKNISEKIATRDIADKLMQVDEYYDKDHIDHWILISPNEDVSNELENFIDSWEKKGKFSFKVQAWTPATRVKEFFGLNPDIYDKIIKVPDLEIHPKDWSEEKRQEVIEFWKQILEPPLRLPQGWEDYLRYENKLLLELDEIEFERRYNDKDYVDMYCKDETGATLSQPLEEKLYDWLEGPVSKSPTLFLLGEFGDGKTFFTYATTKIYLLTCFT